MRTQFLVLVGTLTALVLASCGQDNNNQPVAAIPVTSNQVNPSFTNPCVGMNPGMQGPGAWNNGWGLNNQWGGAWGNRWGNQWGFNNWYQGWQNGVANSTNNGWANGCNGFGAFPGQNGGLMVNNAWGRPIYSTANVLGYRQFQNMVFLQLAPSRYIVVDYLGRTYPINTSIYQYGYNNGVFTYRNRLGAQFYIGAQANLGTGFNWYNPWVYY